MAATRDAPVRRALELYAAQGTPGSYALTPAEAARVHEHLTTRLLGSPVTLSARDLAAIRAATTDPSELAQAILRMRQGRPGTTQLVRAMSRLAPTVVRIQPRHLARYVQGLGFCVRRIKPNGKRYLIHEMALLLGRSHEWLRQKLRRPGLQVVTRHGATERAERAEFERIMHRPHATLAIRTCGSTSPPQRPGDRLAPGRARATSRRRHR